MEGQEAAVDASRAGGLRNRWSEVERWNQWTELICVILLGVASLAAAWSGYQAARWSGEQAKFYAKAGAMRVEASRAETVAYLYTMADLEIFNGWAEAYASGDETLMRFYENRFSPDLAAAVTAWVATDPLVNDDAPSGPFEMPEYTMLEMAASAEKEAEAEALFAKGTEANQQSDEYVLNTVFLATVLFFAGLATKVNGVPARMVTIAMAALLLLFGVGSLFTFPVT